MHLYEDHGADCVERLRGMFAFALWDARAAAAAPRARPRRQEAALLRARGRDALVRVGGEGDPRRTRRSTARWISTRSTRFLHFQYVPHPLSAFAALAQAAARAHARLARTGRARIDRYWKLSYAPQARSLARARGRRSRSATQLLEATRLRLRSDVPLGAFLSGGVDSSAVVAAMARSRRPVKTFSIGFDVERVRRDRASRAKSPSCSAPTTTSCVVEPDAIELLPRLVWHYGEPFADHSAIPSFYLAELTRRHVTVALNGDGGDENFAGYTRYVAGGSRPIRSALPAPREGPALRAASGCRAAASERSFRSRLDRLAAARSLLPPHERYGDVDGVLRPSASGARSTRPTSGHAVHGRTAADVIARPLPRHRTPRTRSTACSTSTCRPTCPATCS